MKRKPALVIVALIFGGALAAVSAQTPTGPQIGSYGNLVGLKDSYGKDILSQISRPWREGYAIAYRVKNVNGDYEDRFVYVIGDQLTKKTLRIESQKPTGAKTVVTTLDRTLEISRTFTWDEKSRALKLSMSVVNTSKADIIVKALEIQLDGRLVAMLTGEKDVASSFKLAALCQILGTGAGCEHGGADCAPCPCGDRCKPGQAYAFVRKRNIPTPPLKGDPFGRLNASLTPTGDAMLSLVWVAYDNLPDFSLGPKKQVSAYYELSSLR